MTNEGRASPRLRATRGPLRRDRAGYTLIEISLVLIIVATMAAIVLPRYASATERYRLDAAAQRIVLDLSEARNIARSENRKVRVQFVTSKDRYALVNEPDPTRPSVDYLVELDEEPYRVDLAAVSFDGKVEIQFNAYGNAVLHPSGESFDVGNITIASGDDQRIIVVHSFTGKAEIE